MATGRSPTDGLRQFQLEGVRDTGKTVGNGSYATVKELDFRGLKCVGKKLHAILYNSASPQEKVTLLERFASECQLLNRLHHPCIVQFLGVYFERDSQLPVMVMEYLHTTLSACLDRGVLPEEINYEILFDVIVGLRYIHEHSPPIIHRDLSANNVLLTPNMSAKISDLGVAKILNINPARLGLMTQTQMPGTPCYMPPEAMVAKPKYTTKVDIFSYGVMMVHILSGEWPIPGETFREDPNNRDLNIPLSEFERRAEHVQKISQVHPLKGLIRQCLNNIQSNRPEAAAIHGRIKAIVDGLPPSFTNRLEMLQQISSLSGQVDMLTKEVERCSAGKGDSLQQGAQSTQLKQKERELEATRQELTAQKQETASLVPRLPRFFRRPRKVKQSTTTLPSTTIQPSSQATLTQRLSPQSKIRWRRCADLPTSMAYPQLVRINNYIYAGGGGSAPTQVHTTFRYSPYEGTCSALPKSPTQSFGLTELEGKPVVVGGVEKDVTPTNVVYTLEGSQEWRKTLPPMPTARFHLTAFRYKSFLIACGGVTSWSGIDKGARTTAVEVFSSKTSRWYKAEPLPIALSIMSYTIINDTCYLIGGISAGATVTNRAIYASLSSLVQQATAQADPQSPTPSSSPPSANGIWRELPNCPCFHSTAAELGGCLLAIGGILPGSMDGSTLVHLYSPSTNSWVRMPNADLPKPQFNATAMQLANGDIILMGGRVRVGTHYNTVFVGSMEF